MANLPEMLRVVLIAATSGPQAPVMFELERLLIDHGKVQLVRFEHAGPFLEFMQDLIGLPPHFVLIASNPNGDGLDCLEQLRMLETGGALPAIMLAPEWSKPMLERASQHGAASCIQIPEPSARLEVFTVLVTYWCSINEPAN